MKRILTLLTILAFLMAPVLGHAAVSWVISATTRTSLETAINNDVDGGKLKIYDASNNLLATLTLPAKASNSLDTPSAGILTFGAITSVTATGAGDADHFTVTKSDDTVLATGNCAASSAAMNLTTVTIGIGDTIAISAFTWTVPAGS